jgi:hypothetical protein
MMENLSALHQAARRGVGLAAFSKNTLSLCSKLLLRRKARRLNPHYLSG